MDYRLHELWMKAKCLCMMCEMNESLLSRLPFSVCIVYSVCLNGKVGKSIQRYCKVIQACVCVRYVYGIDWCAALWCENMPYLCTPFRDMLNMQVIVVLYFVLCIASGWTSKAAPSQALFSLNALFMIFRLLITTCRIGVTSKRRTSTSNSPHCYGIDIHLTNTRLTFFGIANCLEIFN